MLSLKISLKRDSTRLFVESSVLSKNHVKNNLSQQFLRMLIFLEKQTAVIAFPAYDSDDDLRPRMRNN